jgi:hypothetical protein
MCQAPAAGQSSGLLMASGQSALSPIFCRHAVMARQSWSSHPWMSKKDLQDCNNMATLGNVSNRGPLKSGLKASLLRRLSFLPPPAGVAASRDHKCTGSLLFGKSAIPTPSSENRPAIMVRFRGSSKRQNSRLWGSTS